MMKILTKDLVFLYETIQNIANKENIENAPVDVKFLLVRNARSIQSIYVDFMDARRNIVMANSALAEDNSENRIATSEQLKYINSEIEKLGKVEIEVSLTPIPLAKLESLNLGIVDMNGLYPIIANEEAY